MGEKTNIMVNNIPKSFTNDEFRELFTKFGAIKGGKVVRNRNTTESMGFGFIDFQEPDDARCAIETMNNYQIQNKKLLVKLARIDDPKKRNLYVSQLPASYTDQDLHTLFSQYGNVLETKVLMDKKTGQSKKVGFVVYEWHDDAANAMNGLNKHTPPGEKSPLMVKYASPPEDGKSGRREKNQPLFVDPLNPGQNMGMQGMGMQGMGMQGMGMQGMSCMPDYPQGMHGGCCPNAHMSGQFSHHQSCMNFHGQCSGRNFDCPPMRDYDCAPKRDFDCTMRDMPMRDYNDYPMGDMDYNMRGNQPMRGFGQMSDMDYNSGFGQGGQYDMNQMRHQSNFDFNQSRMQGGMEMNAGKQDMMGGGYGDQSNLTLYVYGIGTDATDTTLWSMFAPIGRVDKVNVVYDQANKCKGYGFVTMKDVSEAVVAIEKLNGTMFQGKKLQVSFHHKKTRRN